MAETASLFLAYSAFQNVIRTFTSSSTTERLTIPQLGLAAGGAGFLISFVLFVSFSWPGVWFWLTDISFFLCSFFVYRTPIELVKCKMQVQMMNFHPVKPAPAAPGRILRRAVPLHRLLHIHPHQHGKHIHISTPLHMYLIYLNLKPPLQR